ncbi:MAG: DUF5946 family protein [Pseudomonadota bacterium]
MEQPRTTHLSCSGCGAVFDATNGPTHPYMLSSAGCWEAYAEILAREYQDPALFAKAHRFTVDAYALQHPGHRDDRRAYRSVRLHYASLFLIIEHNFSVKDATRSLKTLSEAQFEPLCSRPDGFALTVCDIRKAPIDQHSDLVRQWAEISYRAWAILRRDTSRLIAHLL